MEKLNMHTQDMAEANIEKIGQLFPNCLTERIVGKDKDGKDIVDKAIDFDKLKQELSKEIVEGNQERYQFTWPGKREAMRLANTPTNMTLRPDRESSVDFDNTENLYIEGDNLEVLKLLRENYLGKVKMIYIDPPYNTGNDFVYEDDFSETAREFRDKSGMFDEEGNMVLDNYHINALSEGKFHTKWLNEMYPRLKVAKDLLREDGVIFISIDDNEVENLRKICDEIFGQSNLVAQIPWQSRASIQNDTDFSVNHEYVCVYAKNRRQENRRLKESNAGVWYKKDSFVCRPLPLDNSKFENPDNDPRGPWKADPFDAPHVRPNLTYPITNPNTGEQHLPPRGRHWRTEPAQFSSAFKDGRILFGKDGKGRPQLKVFYEEKKAFGSIDNSWFSAERIGTSTQGTKEQIKLFDGVAYFDTPKPTTLLSKLLFLGNVEKNDIILDFFSGSATTAHAIMQMNSDLCSQCRYIMVQLPEITPVGSEARKAGYETICEIGKERIRRAGKKILEERQAKQGNTDLFCQHEPEHTLDTGFRVLKLDTSNMQDVYYKPEDFSEKTLFEDNVKPDRTPEDLLFQVMLECNLPLSAKIEKKTIAGKEVFNVNDGYLLACFDEDVNETVITEVAKQEPYYFIMRDKSLSSDQVADNFEQIFNAYSKDTIRKIL